MLGYVELTYTILVCKFTLIYVPNTQSSQDLLYIIVSKAYKA
jgi:hypothetical protein